MKTEKEILERIKAHHNKINAINEKIKRDYSEDGNLALSVAILISEQSIEELEWVLKKH